MDKVAQQKLGLTERSDDELHSVVNRFQAKWNDKARRLGIQ
ncbi:MAG TPA: hypothetical protein PLT04_02605 [Candidatus Saccharibacteria bacterium]|jgi:hypothetical protein|nr:hypothetical protein [Candidatus Saccharibacteria bacterium]